MDFKQLLDMSLGQCWLREKVGGFALARESFEGVSYDVVEGVDKLLVIVPAGAFWRVVQLTACEAF